MKNLTTDQQQLITMLSNTDIQLSGFLMDNMKPTMLYPSQPDSYNKQIIQQFSKYLDLIEKLGWIEHTSDWDPYIIIQFHDGTEFETESGYYSITEIHDTGFTIEYGTDNEDDPATAYFEYSEIKSIYLTA